MSIVSYWGKFSSKASSILTLIRFKPFDISTDEGRSKERYRRVALTAVGSVFSKCVTLLTGLISVPLTVNYLGIERYGLWMTISSMVTFLTFADLGLGNGLLNAISKADGEGDSKAAATAISSAFFLLFAVSFFLLTVFLLVYPYVEWGRVFNVTSPIAIVESGPAVFVLVLICLLNIPLGIVQRIQMGYQEGYLTQIWASFGAILGLAALLIAIYFEAGLSWLALSISAGPLVSTILNAFQLFYNRPEFLPKWSGFDFSVSKSLISVGILFFVLQIFTLIGNSIDNIIIAQTLGASSVAVYAVTKKMFMVVQIGQYAIQPLWPAFGESMARNDYAWAKRALIRILKFSLISGGVLALPLFLFGREIVSVWVGAELVPPIPLLIGFFFWVFLVNYGGAMSVFFNSGPLLNRQVAFIGLASLSSVVFQIILVHLIGGAGAVWGILAGYGIFYAIPSYRLAFGFLNEKRLRV